MSAGKTIVEQEQQPTYLAFLTSGVASAVVPLEDGQAPEVEIIGSEGLVGFRALLSEHTFSAAYISQLDTTGFRVPCSLLRTLFHEVSAFREAVLEFDVVQASIAARLAACNTVHSAEPRIARWLSMIADRLHSALIPVTQERLAERLNLSRGTVNLIFAELEKAGIIGRGRGRVIISDQEALEARSCGCLLFCRHATQSLYIGQSSELVA